MGGAMGGGAEREEIVRFAAMVPLGWKHPKIGVEEPLRLGANQA
jgi:hypothetical protein